MSGTKILKSFTGNSLKAFRLKHSRDQWLDPGRSLWLTWTTYMRPISESGLSWHSPELEYRDFTIFLVSGHPSNRDSQTGQTNFDTPVYFFVYSIPDRTLLAKLCHIRSAWSIDIWSECPSEYCRLCSISLYMQWFHRDISAGTFYLKRGVELEFEWFTS